MERKVQNSWFDPTVKDREKLIDSYLIAWGAAQAVDELLKMEAAMRNKVEFLAKKERGELVDNFKIGA